MKAVLEVVILRCRIPTHRQSSTAIKSVSSSTSTTLPAPDFRVIQLTPQGSATSVQFGVGLTDAPVGWVRGLYLVVPDIEASRRELTGRGVAVSEIRHKDTVGGWRGSSLPGLDATRADYASFADFHDPDGNTWVLQERGYR